MPCCNAAIYVWATTSHSIYVNFCYLLLVELCFGTLLFLICFFWGFTALNGVVFQVVTSNQQNIKKEFLTLDEVKQLAATPCDIPVLKSASLFACLTGLRISDILKLRWEDFEIAPDQGYCLRIRTQKTQTEATLPISNEAYELCGEPSTGIVFKGLKRSMINHPLKAWLKKAGITKPFSFHCFRHSYATIQIALGTDIYTVSKMLTHKNVSTTQIYADLVNAKKRETANKISLK